MALSRTPIQLYNSHTTDLLVTCCRTSVKRQLPTVEEATIRPTRTGSNSNSWRFLLPTSKFLVLDRHPAGTNWALHSSPLSDRGRKCGTDGITPPDGPARCCGLLNAHLTWPRADVVQTASDILLWAVFHPIGQPVHPAVASFSASFVGRTIHDNLPKSSSRVVQPVGPYSVLLALPSFLNIIPSVLGSSCKLLAGFTRRLLLKLLLEPEKIYVDVISASGQCGLPISAGALEPLKEAQTTSTSVLNCLIS